MGPSADVDWHQNSGAHRQLTRRQGAQPLKAFKRNLLAVLFGALLLSACTDNGSTGGGQGGTDRPTSGPTVTPTVQPSSSQSTSSPSPSANSPNAVRLCDTKVESANPALRSVRFGRHDTYDRLAFDFCKPADTTLEATAVKQLSEDASGDKVTLRGRYFYAVRLTPADAHDSAGRATVSNRAVTVAGNYMQQYKLIGDFEGVVTYGVGVRRLEEIAVAIQSDTDDPRHIVLYLDLGPQSG